MNLRYQILIKKYFLGELDDKQLRELASWVSGSPEAAMEFKQELKRLELLPPVENSAVEPFIEKLIVERKTRLKRRRVRIAAVCGAVAAALCVVIVIPFLSLRHSEKESVVAAAVHKLAPVLTDEGPLKDELENFFVSQEALVHIAPADAKLAVVLPDGTSVTLNKGSRLELNPSFGKTERKVSLDGEAFFDVRKDPSRPFSICCSDQTYVVKGTSFNIMSYSEENYSVVTLHTGSLAAHIKEDVLMLTPGDELSIDGLDGEIRRRKVDVGKSTGWMKDNALHFGSSPLRVVAMQIGKKYGVKVHVNPEVAGIMYEGVIDDEPLDLAFKLLSITAPQKIVVEKLNETDYYIKKGIQL